MTVLQRAQVIQNDKLIASFGQSRLLKDAARPRVEVTVTPMIEAQTGAGVGP